MKYSQRYPDFWGALLGGMPSGVLFAGFFFAFLGVILRTLIKALEAEESTTGKKFFSQNATKFAIRTMITVIVIFLSLRFYRELNVGEPNDVLSMLYCFGVGYSVDRAIEKLKAKNS